jgi:hypothetical protein
MPRQAAASQGFAANGSTRSLIRPPDDLNQLERAEFVNVVLGSPPNHFLPADIATISLHVRHVVGERAFGELQAAPIVDGKASPWLAIMLAHARVVTTTARRLHINPAGRVPTKSPEPDAPISYYERLAMEQRNGEPGPN